MEGSRKTSKAAPDAPPPLYDCSRCPAYCCSYARIAVTERDLGRLARHLGLGREDARRRLTKTVSGEAVLRHRRDAIYGSVCVLLDPDTRRCTVYRARPEVCRAYPGVRRCLYYDFLTWERGRQGDPEFIPLRLG